jgi:hypothetical protein
MPIADRADDVAHNFYRPRHAAKPSLEALLRRGWHNVSHGFAEARNADRFAGLAHLFEDAEALNLKFRNTNFPHALYCIPWP